MTRKQVVFIVALSLGLAGTLLANSVIVQINAILVQNGTALGRMNASQIEQFLRQQQHNLQNTMQYVQAFLPFMARVILGLLVSVALFFGAGNLIKGLDVNTVAVVSTSQYAFTTVSNESFESRQEFVSIISKVRPRA